jgi:PAS domain S-box-containing protein
MNGSLPAFGEHEAYRSIFEHSMDAVLLTAPDGRIILANQASTLMFGYSASELYALGRDAVVDPSDTRLAAALETRQRHGRFRGELTMRRKDGTRFPVELSSAIFRDEQGTEWTSMVIRDITDRKAQEDERERLLQQLHAKRRWLEAVLEHVPLSVLLFEPDGRLSFNRKAEETIGTPLTSTGGSAQYRARVLFPDGTPVAHEQLISTRVLEHGETITGAEFLVERPDGTRVPILGGAGPIRDDDGHIIGAIGVFQDVSEQMRVAEAVRQSERLLNGIFELLPVGVWIADRTGRIVRGNPAGMRIWGGARYVGPERFGEYRGWWADTGKGIEADEWALARALARGETSIGEVIRILCFDGTYKTIINSALPLYDEAGGFAGAIVVNEDITTLKDTEAALRGALQSRERVLEIVAHDLRHPLQVILAVTQALLLADRSPADRNALGDIEAQVRRMDQLIQDLVDVAQLESGLFSLRCSRLSPEALLHEVWETYERLAAASSLEFRRDLGPGLPAISVDRERLRRVFDNLIGNAVKFTPAGGRITLGAAADDGRVRFWVSDTGSGVHADALAQMFAPRWQAEPGRRGLGLGLDIAKSIVEAHGGRIWADSTVGGGTTVSFTIPSAV